MAKRAISNLPELTAANTNDSDLLICVNNYITKKITVSDLFTAGFNRSATNYISSTTKIGDKINPLFEANKEKGSVSIGGEIDSQYILSVYGDIKVQSPYRFVTDDGNSNQWNDVYTKMELLASDTRNVLLSDSGNEIKAYKIKNTPSVEVVYDDENNTVSFATGNTVYSVTEDISTRDNWILSGGTNSGISISDLNTVAICPLGNTRDYGIGLLSEDKTHVDGYATTIWGDLYLGGKIKVANTTASIEGLGMGTVALQNANNVSIIGGTIADTSISAINFESTGVYDGALGKVLYLTHNNYFVNRVGVGIQVPTEKLDVAGNIKSSGVIVANTSIGGYATIQTKGTSGSYIDIKKVSDDDSVYGFRMHTNGSVNTLFYRQNQRLDIRTSDGVSKATITGLGRLSLGYDSNGDPVLPDVNIQTTGDDIYAKSSIALVNTGTTDNRFSNIYFGNATSSLASWIKYQHYSNSVALNSMIFGILGKEKLRINADSIEFMDSNSTPKMVWDVVNSELRINGNKVWHSGNSGTGSGLDADLLSGKDSAYYRSWTNITNKPSPTITLSGGASGSVTLSGVTSSTLNVSIVDDGHTHTGSTIISTNLDADTCDGQHLGTTANVTFNNIGITGTITETSDRRLKENITPISNALDIINNISGVKYNKINTPKITEIGFIAQEIEEYLPEVVQTDADGYKSINYTRIVALLVEAIKELKNKIN